MNLTQYACLIALPLSIAATAGAQPDSTPNAVPTPTVASPAPPAAPPPAPSDRPAPPPAARPSRDRTGHVALGGAWNVGFPVGSVHDFTQAVSGVGFEFMVRYFVLPQLTVGGSADFQSF